MKNKTDKIEKEGKTLVNGAMALIIVALIAIGCTCNKDFEFGKTGSSNSDGSTVSNTDSDTDTRNGDSTTAPPSDRADASKGEMPSDDELQYMAKTTLLDFNNAIQQADFTEFHGNISRAWQKQISPEKFKQEFGVFIDKGVDISDISSEKASFSPAPSIDSVKNVKMLVLQGSYDISPAPTTFELKYVPEGKEWKLFGIDVKTKSFK